MRITIEKKKVNELKIDEFCAAYLLDFIGFIALAKRDAKRSKVKNGITLPDRYDKEKINLWSLAWKHLSGESLSKEEKTYIKSNYLINRSFYHGIWKTCFNDFKGYLIVKDMSI